MNPNDEKNREMVEELSRRIGLSYSTIDELLEAGWDYQESLGEAPKWVRNRYVVMKR